MYGTQNEMTDSHRLINYMKKVTEYIIQSNISFCEWYR